MANLDRIINIQIDRQTKAIPQKGFGVALFLADDALKPSGQTTRVREYDQDSFKDDFTSGAVFDALTSFFSQALVPEKVLVGYIEGVETVTEALVEIDEENSDWYALAMQDRTLANVKLADAYIATERRIFVSFDDDAEMIDPSSTADLAYDLNQLQRSRTATGYNVSTLSKYPEMAWLGRCLPAEPGSLTWKFKTLSGIIADKLTGTERTALIAKNSNYYNEVGGVNIMEEGWMADGSFIDEIRGVDWLHARMQEAIFARLVNSPKIPYTSAGIDLIINDMEAVGRRAIAQGIIADGTFVITKPNISDIAFNDRAARILPDINFTGVLQGAVHSIKINGVVTV